MTYQEYLKTEHWQTMRRLALEASDGHCALCDHSEQLDVHHRTYERLGHERLRDLIVLCHECHERHHGIIENAAAGLDASLRIKFLEAELAAEMAGAAFLAAQVERAWKEGIAEGEKRRPRRKKAA